MRRTHPVRSDTSRSRNSRLNKTFLRETSAGKGVQLADSRFRATIPSSPKQYQTRFRLSWAR